MVASSAREFPNNLIDTDVGFKLVRSAVLYGPNASGKKNCGGDGLRQWFTGNTNESGNAVAHHAFPFLAGSDVQHQAQQVSCQILDF